MAKTKAEILIPFDGDGNLLHWADPRPGLSRDAKWEPNHEFDDVLSYVDFERGRSAAYLVLKSEKSGHKYCVFMTDFSPMIPLFAGGRVAGRFTFQKRGQNYGLRLVDGRDQPDLRGALTRIASLAAGSEPSRCDKIHEIATQALS